jgi:hypothetical protein
MNKSKPRQPKQTREDPNKGSQATEQGTASKRSSDAVEGEGSYTAASDYGKSVKDFVDSGQVDQASRDAEPRNDAEAQEMQRAEVAGRSRAKEEDPEVSQPHTRTREDRGTQRDDEERPSTKTR